MTTTNQWIPIAGPGGRLPTIEDADSAGLVYVTFDGKYDVCPWDSIPHFATHFLPIQKVPPLPKPREKTQQAIDMEKVNDLLRGNADLIIFGLNCLTHGRSDGRADLAREALKLLNFKHAQTVAIDQGYQALPIALRHLEELLTKAAEEKP